MTQDLPDNRRTRRDGSARVQGVTTDDDPVYGPGLNRQPSAVHRQRTVGRHIRSLDVDALPHLDRDLLPILQRRARAGGTGGGTGAVRLNPEVCKLLGHLVTRGNDLVHSRRHPDVPASTNRIEGWFGYLKFRARLTRGLKTEADPRHCVGLMACGMA